MSLERSPQARRDRRWSYLLASVFGLILAGVLAVQTLHLRETRELARRLVHKPQGVLSPVVLPVSCPGEPARESVDGWTMEHLCFRGEDVFVSGSSKVCVSRKPPDSEAPDSQDCTWRFRKGAGDDDTFEKFLRDPKHEGAIGMIVIFGGHDSRRLRPGAQDSLDSNFDLAHRRADAIARVLREKLKDRPWALLPLAGSYPPPCGDSGGGPETSEEERRRPLLLVTLWRPPT